MIEYDETILLENFGKVCRFCLSLCNCVDIFCGEKINEALEKATDFIVSKVDESDGLPNNICQRCLQCVVEFSELEARCEQAYTILQNITELRNVGYEKSEVPPVENIAISDDVSSFDEESCEYFYLESEEVSDIAHHSEELEKQDATNDTDEEKNAPIESEKEFLPAKKGKCCPVCGKMVSQLSKHLPTHSDVKKHSCTHCPKQFAHDTTLRRHIRSVHLRIKNYKCDHCSEAFTDRSSLRYHDIAKHKNARNYSCSICNKSYYTSTGLQQHNSLTHEQRKFKCGECGKMFAMKYHLKEHEKTHSDERPFDCTICLRTFKRLKNLNEHMSVHKEEA